jgi:hypothetical protein
VVTEEIAFRLESRAPAESLLLGRERERGERDDDDDDMDNEEEDGRQKSAGAELMRARIESNLSFVSNLRRMLIMMMMTNDNWKKNVRLL